MIPKLCSHLSAFVSLMLILAVALTASPSYAAPASALRIDTTSKVTIVLPTEAIPEEEAAAKDLQRYLTQISGAACQIIPENQLGSANGTVIYIGPTEFTRTHLGSKSTFGEEEWLIQTQENALILTGGRPRGTAFAVYHFLEDVCGVHWWNPWEETVPARKVLSIPPLNKRDQPAFRYRDVYSTYATDYVGFAARSRLGGVYTYGPPAQSHTFYYSAYLPPKEYYAAHPDWFIGNGKDAPTVDNSQLAMSNPEMRQEFLKKLLANIRSSRQAAIEKGATPPNLFDISQNDNGVSLASPGDEALLKANDGAESAVLLSFLNYLADGIKTEFPNVYISTLAYYSGEKAPTTISASDNIIVRLTDTKSNVVLPITAQRNHAFRENVEAWEKHAKHLWVWDYYVTYRYPHLPTPTMQTYPTDLRFLSQHNVEGLFIEFEFPMADMRDMKLWIACKLMENSNLDYDALVREFTDGFYGAAAPYVRQYLDALQKAAEDSNADIKWFEELSGFNYLTPDFLKRADAIFSEAAEKVANDPVRSMRIRNARSSVDYATLILYSQLKSKWVQGGHSPATFPFDQAGIAKRYRQTSDEQIELRSPAANHAKEHQAAELDIKALTAPVPAKFKDVPVDRLVTYTAQNASSASTQVTLELDPLAESGIARRTDIADAELEKYKLPMPWGIYDTAGKKSLLSGRINEADVPDAGYNWYRLGEVTLTGHDYLYFFWSWIIQQQLDDAFNAQDPTAKYEVWASLRFEGPAFPHGKAGDKNAIFAERVVLVKQ